MRRAARARSREAENGNAAGGGWPPCGVDERRWAVVRLAELDHAVKGGSRLAAELELGRTLIAITRPAGGAVAATG